MFICVRVLGLKIILKFQNIVTPLKGLREIIMHSLKVFSKVYKNLLSIIGNVVFRMKTQMNIYLNCICIRSRDYGQDINLLN